MKKALLISVIGILLVLTFSGCVAPINIDPGPGPVCPYLTVNNTSVSSENIYGIIEKKFYVLVQNVSNKVVTAYKVRIRGYNAFNERVNIDFSDTFVGYADNKYIEPGETYGGSSYWSSVYADTVHHITAEIIQVLFNDGTQWVQ